MIDEVKAAAERKMNGIASSICHNDIYGCGDEDRCNRILADAYLATVRNDSELPVTEQWLRSVGFFDGGTLTLRIEYLCDDLRTELCCMMGDDLNRWSIGQNVGNRIYYVGIAPAKTRGHVRQLCTALGITLTEPTQ